MESAPNFRPAVCGVCWSAGVPRGGHRRPGNPSPIVALDLSRAGRRRLTDLPTSLQPQFKCVHRHQLQGCGFRRKSLLRATPALSRPSNCSIVPSGVTARFNLPQFSLSHWKQRGTTFSSSNQTESTLDERFKSDLNLSLIHNDYTERGYCSRV